MAKEVINLLVKGGAATAGPPLGPALSGKGINIGQVVKDINDKTKGLAGMDVPVKVIVNSEAKSYEITVGLPPTSALLKKEAGAEKGSGLAGTKPAGALKIEHIIGIADIKADAMLGKTLKARVKEIVGTCVSLGMHVEGKPAKVVMKELESGVYDSKIKAKKITLTAEENSAWESEKQAAIRQAEQLEKAVAAAAAAAQAAATPAEGAAPAEGAVAKPEGRKKAIS